VTRLLAGVLIGLGAGLAFGYAVDHPALAFVGPAAVVVGVLVAFRARDGRSAPTPAASPAPPREDGLADRVGQILRLAEEQAADTRAEAERVLADARAEARSLVDEARRPATGV